jgi:DNA uptake protein ComE-like DNA-binding protein
MKSVLFLLGAGLGIYGLSHLLKQRRDSGADLLDLNSATERKLSRLPGMLPDLVERIVENRPYATKIDLVGRRVIPDDTYELIKHVITVSHAA